MKRSGNRDRGKTHKINQRTETHRYQKPENGTQTKHNSIQTKAQHKANSREGMSETGGERRQEVEITQTRKDQTNTKNRQETTAERQNGRNLIT